MSEIVALVTGAGRGIGRAVAGGLARSGAAVAITARTRADLETLRDELVSESRRVISIEGDASDLDDATRVVQRTTEELGPISLLVNNAGISGPDLPLWQVDPREWWRTIEVNLRSAVNLSALVLPGMIERDSGRVVNINSLAGANRFPLSSAYAVSKGALIRLTDSMASNLQGTRVKVFDVSPGLVRTDMTAGVPMFADLPDENWTPISRVVEIVLEVASGRLDGLSGRFIHAHDDLDSLVANADLIQETDARTLRLSPYGEDDPLG